MHPGIVEFSRPIRGIRRLGLLVAVAAAALVANAAAPAAQPASAPAAGARPTKVQMRRGQKLFQEICFTCHKMNGKGIPGVYPPLAHSDFLRQHRTQIIDVLLEGLKGPVIVRKRKFNNVMPELHLSDRQIADVLTYISNSWGNDYGTVTKKMVSNQRHKLAQGSSGAKGAGNQPAAGKTGNAGMIGQPMMGGHAMMRGAGQMGGMMSSGMGGMMSGGMHGGMMGGGAAKSGGGKSPGSDQKGG